MASFLTALGSAETVRWVLQNERMAFSDFVGKRNASRLTRGDRLYFYLSPRCWPGLGKPKPPSGLIVSDAVVLTDTKKLADRMVLSGHVFTYGCELLFERLAPSGTGVSLNGMIGQLELFRGYSNYGNALRLTPILLSTSDAKLIDLELNSVSKQFDDAVIGYGKPDSNGPTQRRDRWGTTDGTQ